MHLPAYINPQDHSQEANRNRAMHAQAMLQLSPNGNGFQRIPEKSNQNSLVERYLITAGDMKQLPLVPSDRRYRQKRREPDERQKRRATVAKERLAGVSSAASTALKPITRRGLSLEPNDNLVMQVSDAFKDAKSPAEFVMGFISRLGISSMAEYDRMATRAERFMRSLDKNPHKRIPGHIRDKFVMKRIVELVLAKRWPATTATPV